MKNKNIFLSLGSNLGDRLHHLQAAMDAIAVFSILIKYSSIYESEAWGFESLPFYNNMIEIETDLDCFELLEKLKEIETELGRTQKTKNGYSDRTIDIDIICFDNLIIKDSSLILPHPLFHLRNFVLFPFYEIAPKFKPNGFEVDLYTVKNQCLDESKVKRLTKFNIVR